MATAPVKSQALHNFSLPFLKWGGTVNSNRFRRPDHPSEPDSEPHRVGPRTSRNNRFALRPCSNHHDETDDEAGERKRDTAEEPEETVQKPWNLRPRKPANPVFMTGSKISNGEGQEPVHSVTENGGTKSLRLRGETTMQCGERKKEKFWIALSKDEIEEDIFVMTGSRPSRRPKKRPKIVQKQIDNVFPGLWLVGVTADAYKVADTPSKENEDFDDGFCRGREAVNRIAACEAEFIKLLDMVTGSWNGWRYKCAGFCNE